jgi:hypothetical protein
MPMSHGEGRFVAHDAVLRTLIEMVRLLPNMWISRVKPPFRGVLIRTVQFMQSKVLPAGTDGCLEKWVTLNGSARIFIKTYLEIWISRFLKRALIILNKC